MKNEIKLFIENAYNIGKDKKYVRDYLYGKIKDTELKEALDYFDYLSKGKKYFSYYPKFFLSLIKVFFLYIVFLITKFLALTRSFFLRKKVSETDFEEFKKEANIILGIKKWFSKKSKKEKTKIVIFGIIALFLILVILYANFFYYKKCPNETCLRDRIEKCQRATYETEDFLLLFNRIGGRGINRCNAEVSFFSKENKKEMKMICRLPLKQRELPYSRIEYCSGELREFIQGKMIVEIQKSIGENLRDLNSFFVS